VRFELANNIDAANWYDKGRPVAVGLVADDAGNPLPYLHRWHQLLVVLPRPLAKGEKAVVHVKATEDTIIELTDRSYWIYTDSPWFPKIGGETGRYTFDWIVKVAKPMQAAGSGDLVRAWQEGNTNCNEWKSDLPVSLASFIFGEFKTTDGEYKREAGSGSTRSRAAGSISRGSRRTSCSTSSRGSRCTSRSTDRSPTARSTSRRWRTDWDSPRVRPASSSWANRWATRAAGACPTS
jgi:hypothetical protein